MKSPSARLGSVRRGFLTLDALLGLTMAVLVLMTLSATIVKQQAAEKHLSLIRTATHRADALLLQMQAGATPPADARIEKLPNPALPNRVWVRLTLPAHDSAPAVSLVGLIPAKSLDQGVRP